MRRIQRSGSWITITSKTCGQCSGRLILSSFLGFIVKVTDLFRWTRLKGWLVGIAVDRRSNRTISTFTSLFESIARIPVRSSIQHYSFLADYAVPVFVIIDVNPSLAEVPTKAYYSVEEVGEDNQTVNRFHHVPAIIGALEAEEVISPRFLPLLTDNVDFLACLRLVLSTFSAMLRTRTFPLSPPRLTIKFCLWRSTLFWVQW